ncbi:MAG: GTPase, partial [Alphaproteobacteria bacterium]
MTRCGYVALLGAANVGKSTLVNALVGAKVAIVSAKAQTTRARVTGIAISGESQLVLLDLPGIFAPRRRSAARGRRPRRRARPRRPSR